MKAMKGKKGLTVFLSALFLVTISFGLYGCAKKASETKSAATAPAAPAATAPAANSNNSTAATATTAAPAATAASTGTSANAKAAAMKIINAQGCAGCHVIDGKGGSIGPNLSKEGTKGHSIHWLEVQINNPKAHNPKTMMPAHNLSNADLKTVAEFLESSK